MLALRLNELAELCDAWHLTLPADIDPALEELRAAIGGRL
jgi:hypothetical protein